MFGRKKEKKRIVEKVLLGAVIGGAIGSVLGATLAPKKGAETRADIVDATKEVAADSKKLFKRIKAIFKRKKKIPHEVP